MSTSAPGGPASLSDWTRARWGVVLMFLTNGAVMGAIMPRYPELKSALSLTNAAFGMLVAAVAVGSIAASGLPALAIRRLGARRTSTLGTVAMAVAMALVGLRPTTWSVALLLGALGLLDAVVDAAQNVHGLLVERGLGRTVINSMHASWSVGAALAGCAAALAAGAGVPLAWHLCLNGLVVTAAAVAGYRLARPPAAAGIPEGGVGAQDPSVARSEAAASAARGARRPTGTAWLLLLVLGVLALVGAMIEHIGNNWSANFLHDSAGLPVSAAGFGYVTLLVCQFLGRILGDVMTDRLGRNRVALLGGLCIAAGFAVVVLLPAAWWGFVSFGLAGFGCATLIPTAYAEADRVEEFGEGTGITAVGWIMRVGFLGTSPAVGAVADAAGLRLAFVIPLVAGLVVAAIACGLVRRSRRAG